MLGGGLGRAEKCAPLPGSDVRLLMCPAVSCTCQAQYGMRRTQAAVKNEHWKSACDVPAGEAGSASVAALFVARNAAHVPCTSGGPKIESHVDFDFDYERERDYDDDKW